MKNPFEYVGIAYDMACSRQLSADSQLPDCPSSGHENRQRGPHLRLADDTGN